MSQLDFDTNNQFNLDEIYSVSDFLSLCNSTIENNIPTCWLKGEISNLSCPTSGHWYFFLKDRRGQVRCVLFRLNQHNIKFNPKNGMEVLLRAASTLYEVRGNFQLIVRHIEAVGVGNRQVAFEQLKEKLRDKGWFDAKHKKSLPIKVDIIGVISSSNGAVIRDIIKVLNKRYPFAKILLFDCVVQGEGSEKKLAEAIYAADKYGHCDVLILARGGGSLEDLWSFNEEVLAKAIFSTTTPIISAIGHETDTTIADFVADKRAPTASAAAMMITPDKLELLTQLRKLYTNLLQKMQQSLGNCQYQLGQLNSRILKPNKEVNVFLKRLDRLYSNLNYYMKITLNLKQSKFNTLFEQLKQHSPSADITYKKELNQLEKTQLRNNIRRAITKQHLNLLILIQNLEKSMRGNLEQEQNKLSIHIIGLTHLSPLKTLSRGYSISMLQDSQVLNSTTKVKIGVLMTTRLSDGKIYSKVEKIEKS
jgi:exodeoxyribonuclease VII large subunit